MESGKQWHSGPVQVRLVKFSTPGEFWISMPVVETNDYSESDFWCDVTGKVTSLLEPKRNEPFTSNTLKVGEMVGISCTKSKIWRPAVCTGIINNREGMRTEVLLLDNGQVRQVTRFQYRELDSNFVVTKRYKHLYLYNVIPSEFSTSIGKTWCRDAIELTRIYLRNAGKIHIEPVYRKSVKGSIESVFAYIYLLIDQMVVDLRKTLIEKGYCTENLEEFESLHGLSELKEEHNQMHPLQQEHKTSATQPWSECNGRSPEHSAHGFEDDKLEGHVTPERRKILDPEQWIEKKRIEENNISFRKSSPMEQTKALRSMLGLGERASTDENVNDGNMLSPNRSQNRTINQFPNGDTSVSPRGRGRGNICPANRDFTRERSDANGKPKVEVSRSHSSLGDENDLSALSSDSSRRGSPELRNGRISNGQMNGTEFSERETPCNEVPRRVQQLKRIAHTFDDSRRQSICESSANSVEEEEQSSVTPGRVHALRMLAQIASSSSTRSLSNGWEPSTSNGFSSAQIQSDRLEIMKAYLQSHPVNRY